MKLIGRWFEPLALSVFTFQSVMKRALRLDGGGSVVGAVNKESSIIWAGM